jgi:hypothetical protein
MNERHAPITAKCSMCGGTAQVPFARDGHRQMDLVFMAGFHAIHIEPPMHDDHDAINAHSHTHSLVCCGCAMRIVGRKPS